MASDSHKWAKIENKIKEYFDVPEEEEVDLFTILFVIGLQEVGISNRSKVSKQEKLELIHVGICTVLEPYGYYELEGKDKDGWLHFKNIQKLPALKTGEQSILLKKAIINYFSAI